MLDSLRPSSFVRMNLCANDLFSFAHLFSPSLFMQDPACFRVVRKKVATSFDDLPMAIRIQILELAFPRLVFRVRTCLVVSKQWRQMCFRPDFVSHLEFKGAHVEHLTEQVLLRLVGGAQGQLQTLDLSAALATTNCEGVLRYIIKRGLATRLRSLVLGGRHPIMDARLACSLRAGCPLLAHAAVDVCGIWRTAITSLRALQQLGVGRATVRLDDGRADNSDDALFFDHLDCTFASFARGLAGALAECPIGILELGPGGGGHEGIAPRQLAGGGDDDAAACAQLAAVLAHPAHGPRALHVPGCGVATTPLLTQTCLLLAQESRLRALVVVTEGKVIPLFDTFYHAGVAALTAALEPGRSGLESLVLKRCSMHGTRCAGRAHASRSAHAPTSSARRDFSASARVPHVQGRRPRCRHRPE